MAANRIYIQVDFQSKNANDAINELNKNIAGIGTASQGASKQTQQAMSGISLSIEQTTKSVLGLGQAFAGLAVVRLISDLIETADAIRRVEIAMVSLTGSATVGMRVMGEIAVMSKTNPFSFQGLAEAARTLAVFGFNAKEIPGDVDAISNAVARMGGTTNDIDRITYALGIMKEKGVAQAQQLFRQLAAMGIPVFKFIREGIEQETGKILNDDEIRKLMEKGRLSGEGVSDTILTGLSKLPKATAKMMELPTAQWQKAKDDAAFLAETIEKEMAPAILSVIARIQDLIRWYHQLDPDTRSLITGFGQLALAISAVVLVSKVTAPMWAFLLWVTSLDNAFWKATISAAKFAATAVKLTAEGFAKGGTIAELWSGAQAAEIGASGITIAGGLTVVATAIVALAAAVGEYFAGKQVADFFPQETQDFFRWLADHPNVMAFLASRPEAAPISILASGAKSQMDEDARMAAQMAETARQHTGEDEQRRKTAAEAIRHQAKIIKPDLDAITHQIEESEAILARAQEQELGGLAAIARKYQEQIKNASKALEEAGANGVQRAQVFGNLRLANQANVAHQMIETEKKIADESAKIQAKGLEEQAANAEKAAARKMELAGAVAQDTLVKQGEVAVQQYKIEVDAAAEAARFKDQAAQKVRDKELKDRKEEFVRGAIDLDQYRGYAINAWTEYLNAYTKVWDEAFQKMEKRQDDFVKTMATSTTQSLTNLREGQRAEDLAQIQRAGELARAGVDEGTAQNAAQKTAVYKREAEIEIAIAQETAAKRKDVLEQDYALRITRDEMWREASAEAQKAADADELAATAELIQNETTLRNDAVQTQILAEAQARKKANEAFIEEQKQVYDKLKSAMSTIFDALFEKGKSVWQALADAAKKALMGMLKEIVTSNVAASMMQLFTGQQVTMESRGSFGGPLGKLAGIFTQHPVFATKPLGDLQNIKLFTSTPPPGTAAMPVRLVDDTLAKAKEDAHKTIEIHERRDVNVNVTGAGPSSPAIAKAIADAAGGAGGSGGSSGGGGYTTSSTITYAGGGSESFGSGFGGGGGLGNLGGLGKILGLGSDNASTVGAGATGAAESAATGGAGGLGSTLGLGSDEYASLIGAAGIAKVANNPAVFSSAAATSLAGGLALSGAALGLKGAYSLGQSTNPLAKAAAVPLGALSGLVGAGALAALFPSVFVPLLAAGPVGWIVAAGIGAAVGLYGLLHKTDAQKAHDAVQKAYGIDISNQGVLNAIAQAAKKYGDFNVGIMSPEVQQIIHMYTLSQGINATGILPRPMYSATLAQSSAAGGLQLQPVYSSGQLVASPYSGATTQQWSQGLYIQLNPQQANDLLTGKIVDALNNNPATVSTANAAGLSSGSGLTAQRNALVEPLTVMS